MMCLETAMKEEKVFFGQGDVNCEGLYADSGSAIGAVISHPHSLMGGEMRNPVVETLADTLFGEGMSTLRFNFRGVGRSKGFFDEGRGEQDDVLAAVSFMEHQGIREVMLAGYSFGAWVNAGVIVRRYLLPAIFVSPPIHLLEFDFPNLQGKVGLIICGDRDQFCPSEEIRIVASALSCRLDIIPDTDHFFTAKEKALAESVKAFMVKREVSS
jgi:uncharacterized protein